MVYWLKSFSLQNLEVLDIRSKTSHPLLKIFLIPVNVNRGLVIVKAWVQRSHRRNISLWVSISVGFAPIDFLISGGAILTANIQKRRKCESKLLCKSGHKANGHKHQKKSPSGSPCYHDLQKNVIHFYRCI